MDLIKNIPADKLVYCDEMGVSNNICTLYGWSAKGDRSYAERIGFATKRVSIVGGYITGTKELIAPLEYAGTMNKKGFTEWVCEHLCPLLSKGQYVVMDNASIHKDIKINDAIKKAGCKLLYLPTYSPDLNPIEHCWANFKNYLRRIIDQYNDFASAITVAMTKTFPG